MAIVSSSLAWWPWEASVTLARLTAELEELRDQIGKADGARTTAGEKLGGVNKAIADAEATVSGAQAILSEPAGEAARAHFPSVGALLGSAGLALPDKPESCDRAETRAGSEIGNRIERLRAAKEKLASRIVGAMTSFGNTYPVETNELDASVEAADGYRELHERLAGDDLPRFQAQFKTYLNQNTIREIAPAPTPNVDIRDFKSELLACTEGAVAGAAGDDQYSEDKFLQVKRLIERSKGREGLTDADQKWTRLVTDVRNWYTFTASERYREDDTEYETYADSGGKSGGQKEKLAYTILAASFVYQFKLDTGRPRTFRFTVIGRAVRLEQERVSFGSLERALSTT